MLLLLAVLLGQVPGSTAPEDSTAPDIVYYGGRLVTFYARREEVVLLDSAWVRYRGMTVYSDSIRYDVRLHRLTAYQDVLFSSAGSGTTENITGTELVYDIDSRKGMMRTARTQVENGFFFAGEVWLVRERVLNARGGSYSTCDHEHPHYAFYGPRVKLLMDDVAISRPVLFKLFNVPIVAAPFWMVPVASKRKSGLMPFKVGSSSTEGLHAKNISYYWVINDYSDLTLFADVMTRKGIQFRAEGIYIVNPFASGSIVAGYIDEWGSRRRRYSINATHNPSRFFLGSEFAGGLDLVSDASYVSDYSEDKLDWLKPNSFSSGRISRKLGRVGSFSASATRDVDFRQHFRYYELPAARFAFGAVGLGAGWTASPGLSASNRVDDYSDSTGADTARTTRRSAGASLGISSPQYRLGDVATLSLADGLGMTAGRVVRDSVTNSLALTHSLSLSTQQHFLSTGILTQSVAVGQSNDLADTVPLAASYTAGLSGQLRLFRVYGVEALGIHGLLHSVTPSAGLSYSPRTDTGGLLGRPRFLDPAQAGLTFALGNTFQAKVESARVKRDLGSVSFSTAYDLVSHRLSPLATVLSFQPLQQGEVQLSVEATASCSLPRFRLNPDYVVTTRFAWDRLGTDSARHERGYSLGLGHTLAPGAHMLTATAALAGFGWKLSVSSLGYNFTARQLANYDVTLWRDLHCWEAVFSYRRLGTRWDYDFNVRIKKLPDIRFGRSTFGSLLPSP